MEIENDKFDAGHEKIQLHSTGGNGSVSETEKHSHVNHNPKRKMFAGKGEFMFSVLGYIVGLGNLWRFPYLCMRNGGGAFLIPFVVCMVLIAFPLFFMEIALGQFTAKSIIHCWEACPIFRGIGYGMVIVNGLCSVYYVMIITWTLYYIGHSFISPLLWSSCDNLWNTDQCVSDKSLAAINSSIHSMHNGTRSEEEFWQYNVLDISSGIEEFGTVNLNIMFSLMGAWFIVFLCLMKGVRTMGKVVYVTATLPFVILTVLLVRAITLPGAREGVLYYITPNFTKILDAQVWIEAAIQVFYSTGISAGSLITIASYHNFNNNCLRDSIVLLALSEGTSVYGGFVVFSVLGFMAQSSGVAIENVVRSGPGLVYVAYPEAISRMPLANLWAVLFFLMVLSIGLDTIFGMVEALLTAFMDSCAYLRKHRILFTAGVLTIHFLLGLPLCFQGGMYLFQLFDWYVAAFCVPLFGLLECLVFGWIYGAGNFSRDVKLMTRSSVPFVVRLMWCFITPALLVVLLLIIILEYRPPNYGSYNYPPLANVFGMLFAMIPIIPIPVMAYIEVRKASGLSLIEKIQNALKPSTKWKPGQEESVTSYTEFGQHNFSSWLQRMKWNLVEK